MIVSIALFSGLLLSCPSYQAFGQTDAGGSRCLMVKNSMLEQDR